MSITKEEILDAISNMSVMDVVNLISMIEKKFGVSGTIVPTSTTENNNQKTTEEKTEFNIILNAIGTNKIAVIKAVRSAIGLGLKEAKDLVEKAPITLKENMNKKDVESLKKILEETGASVEIK